MSGIVRGEPGGSSPDVGSSSCGAQVSDESEFAAQTETVADCTQIGGYHGDEEYEESSKRSQDDDEWNDGDENDDDFCLVMEGVCIMLGVKPVKVNSDDGKGK
eukprot:745751-Hanusia_phi.AAC.1